MVSSITVAITAMMATAGLLIIIAERRGLLPEVSVSRNGTQATGSELALKLALAVAFSGAVWLATQWPVGAFYGALSGWLWPHLSNSKRERKERIERVEALATWVESLRDLMAGSAGLQEAIRSSVAVTPKPIRTEVLDLSLRLRHEPIPDSLRRFAIDMKHPLADIVAASLILASTRHAGSLRGVLAMVAKSARDNAHAYREIESGRTEVYAQSRLAGWISSGVIAFMVLTRREFLQPFDSFGGQIALFIILGFFFGSGVALFQLGKPEPPRRVFQGIEHWSAEHKELNSW